MQSILCSGRFVRPFLDLLARYPELESDVEHLTGQPFEQSLDLERARELIERWVQVTGDVDLGLRAGKATCIGSGGPLDYALHSANTLRESILLAQRYTQLYRYTLEFTTAADGHRALLRLESRIAWPRSLADFALSTAYRNHLKPQLSGVAEVACWFKYTQPDSTEAHQTIFDGAKLNFGAPFDGFSFDVSALDRPLASADPILHTAHCGHLDSVFNAMAGPQALALRVRRLIAAQLQHGRPKSTSIARKLRMSRRTLVRQLEAEGTSFTLQLDDLRRELGLRLVTRRSLSLSEITSLLGFSHVQGFHRAFKRWTGQTPVRYREMATDSASTASDTSVDLSLPERE
ncbi:MAG TPA: AraC family transcriptional regulator ligand-binding domain-containing protein [Polyangiales bacterium]|nr:AraC family transcriptional regulator ligand-binding domain-containing protein [Polyangiales bacterium]